MNHSSLPIKDPLLLEPGCLLQTTDHLLGVETAGINLATNKPKQTALYGGDVFMYLDVQPSRRGSSYFRFKIMSGQFIFVEATIAEFKRWFKSVHISA